MPFGRLEIRDDVMWMVVSHAEMEREGEERGRKLVSRFTLTVRRENICLNMGASSERGYPVVKGECFISEHDEGGNEVVPEYCAVEGEGAVMVEDLLCLLVFLDCWVSEEGLCDWEDVTRRGRHIREVYSCFENDGLNAFVPGWETVGMCFLN